MPESLRHVNKWLGWGDPKGGVWFVGIEEGVAFTPEKISSMAGRRYQPVTELRNPNSPVAVRVSKVICLLNGLDDRDAAADYRRCRMGRRGSGVFNANLFPLGKPSTSSWPAAYGRLFGVSRSEYLSRREALHQERVAVFRRFRAKYLPQAIVCFGKQCWSRFEEVFVSSGAKPSRRDRTFDIVSFDSDRVILTPHFARGSLMPNRAVNCVVSILHGWHVRLP